MAFSITPRIGTNLVAPVSATDIASNGQVPSARLGEEVWGSDGKRYVFGKANASISASTTSCTVDPSTFLVTASGGSYTSPATAMVTGDFGWFYATAV